MNVPAVEFQIPERSGEGGFRKRFLKTVSFTSETHSKKSEVKYQVRLVLNLFVLMLPEIWEKDHHSFSRSMG